MQESGVYADQWQECMVHVVCAVLSVKPTKSACAHVLTPTSLYLCCMLLKTYLEQVPNRTKIQRTKVSMLCSEQCPLHSPCGIVSSMDVGTVCSRPICLSVYLAFCPESSDSGEDCYCQVAGPSQLVPGGTNALGVQQRGQVRLRDSE